MAEAMQSAEIDAGYVASARLRGDGTGYFIECPVCHFYKVSDPGEPCRRIGCNGVAVKVEFRVTSPAECICPSSLGFRLHRSPCRRAGEIEPRVTSPAKPGADS